MAIADDSDNERTTHRAYASSVGGGATAPLDHVHIETRQNYWRRKGKLAAAEH